MKYFTVIALLLESPIYIFGIVSKNTNLFFGWKRNKKKTSMIAKPEAHSTVVIVVNIIVWTTSVGSKHTNTCR